ncbi:MAG: polysaccharide deacetylase family protein [Flavobacteriaceae bacterium]
MTGKPIASLSLDLDNAWSYLKTRGDKRWEAMPSYLDLVVPRFLDICARLDLPLTVFVVGADAARKENAGALKKIAAAGCEIGNHSFRHEPWLHLYSRTELEEEIESAEKAIEKATGKRPAGFRGPGFSVSPDVLSVLTRRGYAYDASTFPTIIGPLARLYYFMKAPLSADEQKTRNRLFGRVSDGFRPIKPYGWVLEDATLTEIPVTTMPFLRLPFHLSYLLYLDGWSRALAKAYFLTALALCKTARVAPSFLLHPLDFTGRGEAEGLDFFPAMDRAAEDKLAFAEWALSALKARFDVVTMREHAERIGREPMQLSLPDAHPQAS